MIYHKVQFGETVMRTLPKQVLKCSHALLKVSFGFCKKLMISFLREAAIYWNSKELEGEEEEGGAFVLTLESVTRLCKYLTLDLLSIIAKHSRGILSKKLPPAAESKAS
nr:hypothetical protein [Tanacetum cinerariifolium]